MIGGIFTTVLDSGPLDDNGCRGVSDRGSRTGGVQCNCYVITLLLAVDAAVVRNRKALV